MRNKVSKRGVGYTLLALLLVVIIALPLTMLIPSFGKFTEGNDGTVGVTSTTGTKITDENSLKAWLMGVDSHDGLEKDDGYLQKGNLLDVASVEYTDAYLANGFTFTNNANLQLETGRTLRGNGFVIKLAADRDIDPKFSTVGNISHGALGLIGTAAYNVPGTMTPDANGSTNHRGQYTGEKETHGFQGPNNLRFLYGVFLNSIAKESEIVDLKFEYTGQTLYNYDAHDRTFNMGIVVGRNEGSIDNVSLDMQGFFKFESKSAQPRNAIMIGGIAGYNGGAISNTDIVFSAKAGLQGYTRMNGNGKGVSREYVAGIAGYNDGTVENVMATYKNEDFVCVDGRAIYASTEGDDEDGRQSESFAGSIIGRNMSKQHGAIVNVEKEGLGSINQLVESAADGTEYDGLFAGYSDGDDKDLFTNRNQNGMHGIHQNSGGFKKIEGATITFDRYDPDFLILTLPTTAENAIFWEVNGVKAYENPANVYELEISTVSNHITKCSEGTNLAVTPSKIPDAEVLTYGEMHSFNWTDVFGTIPSFNASSVRVEEVYVEDGTAYTFDKKDRIDAGDYTFQLKYKTIDTKFAYVDNDSKILVEASQIQSVLTRENVKINQKEISLNWTGAGNQYTYDGSNQISKIKASFNDLDEKPINADLKSVKIGSGSDADQGFKNAGEYNISASFTSSNYFAANKTPKKCTMKKEKYDIKGLSLAPYSGQYDGDSHSVKLVLAGSALTDVEDILARFVGDDQIALTPVWTNESMTNVGVEAATFNILSNNTENYEELIFEELQTTITITDKKVDVTWDGANRVYNGEDQINSISATYLDVDDIRREFEISIDSEDKEFRNYAEGGYVFTASLGNNKNYTIKDSEQNATKTYNITTISINLDAVAWTDTISYDYTGEKIVPELNGLLEGVEVVYTITKNNVVRETTAGETISIDAVNVGSYNINADIKANINIVTDGTFDDVDLSFDITPIEYDFSRVDFGNKQYPYKNSAYEIKVDPKLLPVGKDGVALIAIYSTPTFTDVDDSGDTTLTFTSESKNYIIPESASYTAYISIVAAEVVVTWEGRDFTYDGVNHNDAINTTIIASYLALSTEPGGEPIKMDAVVTLYNDANFMNYKEGGYVFLAILNNSNYTATIDAPNTNANGESFAIYHINRIPLTIDASKIITSSTKDSITISFAEGVVGVGAIAIGDADFQRKLVITGLEAVTEYIVKVKLTPDASLSTNFGDSETLLITVSTKYSVTDYEESSAAISDITIDSRAELEHIMFIYNSLSEADKLVKAENFNGLVDDFNAIINGINTAVEDNKKVAGDTNVSIVDEVEEEVPPVDEAAAAAMAATFGLIALAGVGFKKVGGSL